MMKVSDYLVKRVVGLGVKHVFMLTGGGAMHLNDSFGKSSELEKAIHARAATSASLWSRAGLVELIP